MADVQFAGNLFQVSLYLHQQLNLNVNPSMDTVIIVIFLRLISGHFSTLP
jgi:hypothetical protein